MLRLFKFAIFDFGVEETEQFGGFFQFIVTMQIKNERSNEP